MKYFEYRESVLGGYTIAPIYEKFGNPRTEGSFAVLPSRFFGVDFVTWLHMCEANGADLNGKTSYYVIPVWKEPNQAFLNQLNERVDTIAKKIDLKGLSY